MVGAEVSVGDPGSLEIDHDHSLAVGELESWYILVERVDVDLGLVGLGEQAVVGDEVVEI